MSSWVGNPGRPPYVIPRGSAGLKKKSDIGKNHYEESIEYKKEFQTLARTRTLFDIATGQDVDSSSRGVNPQAFIGQQFGPQLPVLALKPGRLSFSMTSRLTGLERSL